MIWKRVFIIYSLFLVINPNVSASFITFYEPQDRWIIHSDGSIFWDIKGKLPHFDHIEMSGEKVSLWIQYGVDSLKHTSVKRTIVFPTFRMKPDDTHASLMYTFRDCDLPRFFINGKPLKSDIINGFANSEMEEKTTGISHKGIMRIYSILGKPTLVSLEHSFFPSVDKPLVLEKFVFTNISRQEIKISMESLNREIKVDGGMSLKAPHLLVQQTLNSGRYTIKPEGRVTFGIFYSAGDLSPSLIDVNKEEVKREQRIIDITDKLQLHTPDSVLNTAFNFAKVRATESIFKTKSGYIHSPGGLTYYAGIWANDQAEYINPFFAILGDSVANCSAMNSYRLFAKYMNPDYNPLPSSIVAQGDTIWNGVGDRGDMAMIAYGASRYALTYGNKDTATVLWPLIEWCLEYCQLKLNSKGVVMSDTDELEGRFPSGDANLSTSVLYYDALISASMLARELGLGKIKSESYIEQSKKLKTNIESYFGATVEGFKTYRYYEGNDLLRSWICLPLTAGIMDRKEGTIDALFSSKLWTLDGLATEAGDKTFWDRSTLYALRGVLIAGETEKAMDYIEYYSRRRLLGEHVPYPVEAYPEGNQRHLSAESGLYCRIFTEGLFGIRPSGFSSFICTPRMPEGWNKIELKNIKAFNSTFDFLVECNSNNKLTICITKGKEIKKYHIKNGDSIIIKLI